jgi:hypothetical protein
MIKSIIFLKGHGDIIWSVSLLMIQSKMHNLWDIVCIYKSITVYAVEI